MHRRLADRKEKIKALRGEGSKLSVVKSRKEYSLSFEGEKCIWKRKRFPAHFHDLTWWYSYLDQLKQHHDDA